MKKESVYDNILSIQSHIKNYDVVFEQNFLFLRQYIKSENRIFLIDRNVYARYKQTIFSDIANTDIILIDALEKKKNLTTVITIYGKLLKQTVKRKLRLIAIGGGILQDIAGFVSSTLYRGIPWICIPTTLLSQLDSCIGSKTSLNFKSYKNMLGTFYPPHRVHIYPQFLKTLSEEDIYCGLGEIVKLHLMDMHGIHDINKIKNDVAMVKRFIGQRDMDVTNILFSSLEIKKRYIESDEFDLGIRNLLNYGHEFGHALETASAYHIPHGVAVSIGIIFANAIAGKRKLLSPKLRKQITDLLLIPIIPAKFIVKRYFSERLLLLGLKKDKKLDSNKLVVVVLKDSFQLEKLVDVTEEEFNFGLQGVVQTLFPVRKQGVI